MFMIMNAVYGREGKEENRENVDQVKPKPNPFSLILNQMNCKKKKEMA